MRMFAISPNVNIDLDRIEAIHEDETGGCVVFISGAPHICRFSSTLLISILKGSQEPEQTQVVGNANVSQGQTDLAY